MMLRIQIMVPRNDNSRRRVSLTDFQPSITGKELILVSAIQYFRSVSRRLVSIPRPCRTRRAVSEVFTNPIETSLTPHFTAMWIDNVWHGRAHTWEKMPWLMKTWKELSGGKPFCIKGINHVEDAKKACDLGVDGLVVTNHAGRQVDGAIASLDALENIVAAVGDRTYIMFDSGVRGASDVVKALALGAKFVFVGRLWVWGLSIMGEHGVRHVMKSLLADLDILMNVSCDSSAT
jgi:hypothetical protein